MGAWRSVLCRAGCLRELQGTWVAIHHALVHLPQRGGQGAAMESVGKGRLMSLILLSLLQVSRGSTGWGGCWGFLFPGGAQGSPIWG